jgi:isoleucyl-tRNA synthetase
LADFPVSDNSFVDKALEEQMLLAQSISSMVLALRRKVNIKVRQPLTQIMMPTVDAHQRQAIEAVKSLILGEVNVKDLKFVDNAAGILVKRVKPDFKKLGPRYGKIMKQLAASVQIMTQEQITELETLGSFCFDVAGEKAVVELADVDIISEDIPGWLVANEGRLTVALDITVTDALRKEGTARELVNRIQNIRKSSGLDITDKINVVITDMPQVKEAFVEYQNYIASQVLANNISLATNVHGTEVDMEEYVIYIDIEKA